jgi:nucleotide-binding universal stress UspA family protein
MEITRILCPSDFSDASAHAIDQVVVITGWHKARITALHVLSPIFLAVPGLATASGNSVEEPEMERLRKETAVRFGAATTAGIGLDVLVDVGQPASRILDRAASLPADLIVLGTHGSGGFEHLICSAR